ncbi:hypothetical protein [Lacinutrix sp. MedPE-SW]|uniref:hypothetical protein n=1 Tax=Lacinutrix sp. MedPE-SW TaxID=1860087 RepID=UPI00091D816C|nr:hypothetical protein [Lacinutrix sp. MedPE-SW]OIQ16981.1 MAG: hypothetical protein BM549_12995 [Lacinutrix sp. MedPE-SW]
MNKHIISFCIIFLIGLECFAFQNESATIQKTIIKNGVGLGSVIAVVTSLDRNKSILFAIIHGLFSWFYVIYYAITRKEE